VSLGRHAAALAVCLAACGSALAAGAGCELVLREHRSGAELQRLPLDAQVQELAIAFEHSVLGTTVVDRYRFMPTAHLIEERYAGEGYGLPYAAGPGESLQRDGDGWVLRLNRPVHPLVVRTLPQQHMRLRLAGQEWLLARWSTQAIEFTTSGCTSEAAH
jgi:hypothetical protein